MKLLAKICFAFVFTAALCVAPVAAQDDFDAEKRRLWQEFNKGKWHEFDFSKQKLTAAQLNKLKPNPDEYSPVDRLALLRGVVFGKRGRIFKERSIQDYLDKQTWYKPNAAFKNSLLTATERANLDAIRLTEAAVHEYVMPGDLRLWQKRAIPEDKINAYPASNAEWRILLAEIEAIHGKTFPDEPWLQKYFEERYWYKANPNYTPAVLTAIERGNLELIKNKRDAERRVEVGVGDMDKFQNAPLTEKMLEGVTLNELRAMRNEIFARRGFKFKAVGIQQRFEFEDWYRPAKDQTKIKLSAIEQQNVDLLLKIENRFRENLATKVISIEDVRELFTEDLRVLRNEIYARRGREFKSKDLLDYFAAQPWYKPNPNYTDDLLSEVEKENIKIIGEAEKEAISKFIIVEG